MSKDYWTINLIDHECYDDEGYRFLAKCWEISDGQFNSYVFPVSEYPTKASAWKAWENKIM